MRYRTRRFLRVQAWWLAMFTAYSVAVLGSGVLDGLPLWAGIVVGLLCGLAMRAAAELIEDRRETARFKRAWRKAMAEGGRPTVID